MGSLGGRAGTADGASMDTDRLQVFSMGGPAPLLDVTPDCIDWLEEGGPNLTVMDVLDILGKHPVVLRSNLLGPTLDALGA